MYRSHVSFLLYLQATAGIQESEVAQLCLTLCDPWTATHQAPLSMGFPRQEYWIGLPCPSAEDLPNPEVKQESLVSPAGRFFTTVEDAKLVNQISHYLAS